VQGLEGLFDRCPVVEPVDLVEIDVVRSQVLQASVDRSQDMLPGKTAFADGGGLGILLKNSALLAR
jgi:hypothetical protein